MKRPLPTENRLQMLADAYTKRAVQLVRLAAKAMEGKP